MHESEKWKWSRPVVSDSVWPHGLQPTRLLHPWDFPGKSTGNCSRMLYWKAPPSSNIHFCRSVELCFSQPLPANYWVSWGTQAHSWETEEFWKSDCGLRNTHSTFFLTEQQASSQLFFLSWLSPSLQVRHISWIDISSHLTWLPPHFLSLKFLLISFLYISSWYLFLGGPPLTHTCTYWDQSHVETRELQICLGIWGWRNLCLLPWGRPMKAHQVIESPHHADSMIQHRNVEMPAWHIQAKCLQTSSLVPVAPE